MEKAAWLPARRAAHAPLAWSESGGQGSPRELTWTSGRQVGAGKGRKQGGAGRGAPCLPSATNTEPRRPNPPSWFILKAELADPRSIQGPLAIHPIASSFLRLLSFWRVLPPVSLLAVPWPSCSVPIMDQVDDIPHKRHFWGPSCRAGVAGPPPAHALRLGIGGHREDVRAAVPSTPRAAWTPGFQRGRCDTVLNLPLQSSVAERFALDIVSQRLRQ